MILKLVPIAIGYLSLLSGWHEYSMRLTLDLIIMPLCVVAMVLGSESISWCCIGVPVLLWAGDAVYIVRWWFEERG